MAEMRHTYDPHGPPGPKEWGLVWTLWTEQGGALPLWWDGELVPEGWDRARRVYAAACAAYPDTIADRAHETANPELPRVLALADMLVSHGLVAARVVRLARVDGRRVEVL
jgi:hypothetical protein